jgi:hypothetical protein
MALRLIVIIGLAQVRRAHDGRLPRDRLTRVFEHIRTPTLSHWRVMALETCKALEEGETAECRELGALLAPIARLMSDLIGHGGDHQCEPAHPGPRLRIGGQQRRLRVFPSPSIKVGTTICGLIARYASTNWSPFSSCRKLSSRAMPFRLSAMRTRKLACER